MTTRDLLAPPPPTIEEPSAPAPAHEGGQGYISPLH